MMWHGGAAALTSAEAAVLLFSAVASWCDLRARRIPNLLTLGGAAAGFVYWGAYAGPYALLTSLGGWATGLALFLPFFALGGMGAGDAKLLACLGAWLGPAAVVRTALYAAIAGGVMAVAVAGLSGYLPIALMNTATLIGYWRTSGLRPFPALTLAQAGGPRLPYALPIAAGAAAAIWWQ